MGAMTKLSAVNQMLLYSGESIVADLEGASGVDTSIAEFILDSKTVDYSERGLANNQRIERVTPDADGHIKVRTDALSVNMITFCPAETEPSRPRLRISTQGGYLFNLTDNTQYFDTTGVRPRLRPGIDWDDMERRSRRLLLCRPPASTKCSRRAILQ